MAGAPNTAASLTGHASDLYRRNREAAGDHWAIATTS
jgi:hypothetical protein